MNYEYIRKLTKEISADIRLEIAMRLMEKGIEMYEKTEAGLYRVIEKRPMSAANEISSEPCELYVSAADLEYARSCVTELGLQECLCALEETQVERSAAEEAEEEYYRKRKTHLIECAAVILLGAVYMIWKSLVR